jgi:hypothetical protein
MLMQQMILFNRQIDDEMLLAIVDRVLMPLIRAD